MLHLGHLKGDGIACSALHCVSYAQGRCLQACCDFHRQPTSALCCTQCWSAPNGERSCSVDATTFGKLGAFVDSQTHFTVDSRSAHQATAVNLRLHPCTACHSHGCDVCAGWQSADICNNALPMQPSR